MGILNGVHHGYVSWPFVVFLCRILLVSMVIRCVLPPPAWHRLPHSVLLCAFLGQFVLPCDVQVGLHGIPCLQVFDLSSSTLLHVLTVLADHCPNSQFSSTCSSRWPCNNRYAAVHFEPILSPSVQQYGHPPHVCLFLSTLSMSIGIVCPQGDECLNFKFGPRGIPRAQQEGGHPFFPGAQNKVLVFYCMRFPFSTNGTIVFMNVFVMQAEQTSVYASMCSTGLCILQHCSGFPLFGGRQSVWTAPPFLTFDAPCAMCRPSQRPWRTSPIWVPTHCTHRLKFQCRWMSSMLQGFQAASRCLLHLQVLDEIVQRA